MENLDNKPRLYVPKERAIRAGPIELDYRVVWGVFSMILGFGALAYFTSSGAWQIGLVAFISLILLNVAFFWMPAAAYGYRYGSLKLRDLLGSNRHASDHPLHGETMDDTTSKPQRPKRIKLLGKVEFIPHETGSGILGIAHDLRYNTWSGAMWGAGSSILSNDQMTQMRRLRAFAAMLDSMAEAGSQIHRFAWHEQTLIGEPQHPQELVQTIRQGAGLSREQPPNQELLLRRTEEMGRASLEHRTVMTLTTRSRDVRFEAKGLGKGDFGYSEVLRQRLESFYSLAMGEESGFSSIGLKAARFASYNDLLLLNRLSLDPVYGQPLWQEWRGRPAEDEGNLLDEQVAWPGYADFSHADYCRLGETFHMGVYISEFTRGGMPPDQLWNVLKLRVPKTVTTVFQMVPARRAQRFAEWSTSGASGNRRFGAGTDHRVTASQVREAESAYAHEDEIAANRGQVGRVRCYIDLTGSSLEEVQANATKLRHACADARFLLEPLTGRQHIGIEAVMPLGRGVQSLTESWKWLSSV